MPTIFETLDKIRNAHDRLLEAIRNAKVAKEPLLYDLQMLTDVYAIFCDKMGDRAKTTNGRKVFTFLALYLYAPGKFYGGRMPKGLRSAIGRITHTRAVTAISNNSVELLIFYQKYPDFKKDVEDVYQEVVTRLHLV